MAWDLQGRMFVALSNGDSFRVSQDGGSSFVPLAPPGLPGGLAIHGDVYLQVDPAGRLWWSALVFQQVRGVDGGIQVARSDDGGTTWAVNQILSAGGGDAMPASDRQWLAFGPGDQVYLSCTCPAATMVQMAASPDGGKSFGAFRPVVALRSSPPAGPLVVNSDGVLLVPYLNGVHPGAEGGLAAAAVAVSVSSDGGATWSPHAVLVDSTSPAACCAWPGAAANGKGFLVSWSQDGGSPMVSASQDGGETWAAPVAWHPGGAANAPNAWVEAAGERTVLAWFEHGDQLWVGAGGTTGPAAVAQVAALHPYTDFPALAVAPDGRIAVAWADKDFFVAVGTPLA